MKRSLLSLCCAFATGVYAQSSLVFANFNLNPGNASSHASSFATINGTLYFTAEGAGGIEPYISNGTPAGTIHLDINTSPSSAANSFAQGYTGYNGSVYFRSQDGIHGTELWVTDQTAAGAHMVADIWPGYMPSAPSYLQVDNGKLLFTATDSIEGNELFVSNGTAAGTQLLKNITPGLNWVGPRALTAVNSRVCFFADDMVHGLEPWVTDGTASGTQLLMDISPGTHGSDKGTSTTSQSIGYIPVGNQLYFGADDGSLGFELWVTDGTTAGTHMVKDIYPGNFNGLHPTAGIDMDGKLYFVGKTAAGGEELWVSDGTLPGTVQVADIYPGSLGSEPSGFTVLNHKLYFVAEDGVHGRELWVSDGTTAGTHLVVDLVSGTPNSDIIRITPYKNCIYFGAKNNSGNKLLWRSNGTAAGTVSLAPPGATQPSPVTGFFNAYVYAGKLFMVANFDSTGDELWSLDDPQPDGVPQVNAEAGISIYPNPAHDNITISLQKIYNTAGAVVYDIYGRSVWQQTLAGNTAIIPLQQLPRGQYIIDLLLDGQHYRQKIVAE